MDKKTILEDLKAGKISLEEAEELLNKKDDNTDSRNFEFDFANFGSKISEKINKAMQFPGLKVDIRGFKANKDDDKEETAWDSILKLAPFASAATLRKMIEKELAKGENIDWSRFVQLAPFLDDEAIASICESALKDASPNIEVVVQLAPFLDSDILMNLIKNSEGVISLKQVHKFAPFLDEEDVDALLEMFLENSDI
ncbi:MAG: hypothetical protein FWE36_04535 [Erysipelotrichales bacterium]|nr:hypothetical protein [Erysipelotrichales bacterium]